MGGFFYRIQVRNKNFQEENTVKKLLKNIRENNDLQFQPEFYGDGVERGYKKIEDPEWNDALDFFKKWKWDDVYLKRRTKPSYTIDYDTQLCSPGFLYPYVASGAFGKGITKDRIELSQKLFEFNILYWNKSFGTLTTWEDKNKKHNLAEGNGLNIEGYFVGKNVIPDKEFNIPSLCWVTYFEKYLVDIIGEEKFHTVKKLNNVEVRKIHDGYLIKAYPDAKLIGTKEGREKERIIEIILGEHLFWNLEKERYKFAKDPEEELKFRQEVIAFYHRKMAKKVCEK